MIFYTIGCRLNQSETAVLQNLFQAQGYHIVQKAESADIAVINTCTVTEKSDSDTRKLIHKTVRKKPGIDIALVGCQAQLQDQILKQWPNVKWIIGNARKMEAASIIDKTFEKNATQVILGTLPNEAFTNPTAGIDRQRTRANLKIQDGCNSFCSYCEVPFARGPARSRVFEDIFKEAEHLALAGYQELVITGINVGQYNHSGHNLVDVIQGLSQISGIERIRISSIEPTTISDELLELMATSLKLCRFLHIPLQSAHNEILKLMNRHYTIEEYKDLIERAVKKIEGIFIGTDIMVGFPQESEAHFNQTFEFLKRAPINYFHVFSYSKRHLAASKSLPQPVLKKTIQARCALLRKLSREKRHMYYKSLLGTRHIVLMESKKNGYWKGFTDNYLPIRVKSSADLSNRFVEVMISEVIQDNIKAILC